MGKSDKWLRNRIKHGFINVVYLGEERKSQWTKSTVFKNAGVKFILSQRQ